MIENLLIIISTTMKHRQHYTIVWIAEVFVNILAMNKEVIVSRGPCVLGYQYVEELTM